jgi:hypothetical protein
MGVTKLFIVCIMIALALTFEGCSCSPSYQRNSSEKSVSEENLEYSRLVWNFHSVVRSRVENGVRRLYISYNSDSEVIWAYEAVYPVPWHAALLAFMRFYCEPNNLECGLTSHFNGRGDKIYVSTRQRGSPNLLVNFVDMEVSGQISNSKRGLDIDATSPSDFELWTYLLDTFSTNFPSRVLVPDENGESRLVDVRPRFNYADDIRESTSSLTVHRTFSFGLSRIEGNGSGTWSFVGLPGEVPAFIVKQTGNQQVPSLTGSSLTEAFEGVVTHLNHHQDQVSGRHIHKIEPNASGFTVHFAESLNELDTQVQHAPTQVHTQPSTPPLHFVGSESQTSQPKKRKQRLRLLQTLYGYDTTTENLG